MGEEIPVFDAWGNEVGKFIPSGGGFGNAIITIIALAFAWVNHLRAMRPFFYGAAKP